MQVAADEDEVRVENHRRERLVVLLPRRVLDEPVLKERGGVDEKVLAQCSQVLRRLVEMGGGHCLVCSALFHT